MGAAIWLAIGLYLLFEGFLPLFFPDKLRQVMLEVAQQPSSTLRRIGGVLFISGLVICIMMFNYFS